MGLLNDYNTLLETPLGLARPRARVPVRLPAGGKTPGFVEAGAGRLRWEFFGAGAAGQAAFVLGLIWLPLVAMRIAPPEVRHNVTPIILTPLTEYTPPPPVRPTVKPVIAPKPAEPLPELPKTRLAFTPRVVAPKSAELKPAPEAPVVNTAFDSQPMFKSKMTAPPRPVEVGSLDSRGSSATPTIAPRPAATVQTGGFGDPNGALEKPIPGKGINVNRAGSFDLPGGPGYGNGTGGASGARGVIASAGFGNGTAVSSPGRAAPQRTVQSTSFGDAAPAATAESKPRAEAAPPRTPVEVLVKPRPDYTAEARQMRIEGAVKLRVVFAASGEIRVLGVLERLGHGLDENAIAAAQRIKFNPARESGRAVDETAVVTIEFKLAY